MKYNPTDRLFGTDGIGAFPGISVNDGMIFKLAKAYIFIPGKEISLRG